LIAVVLAAAYSMWAYARVVHGMPKPYAFAALTDLNRREFWCFVPLISITLWLGIKPNAVLDSLSGCLYFWHQCCLAKQDPTSWVLALI
jgi:NADH:ubiquinone oxidoreductase subunit 4 (subunit M)